MEYLSEEMKQKIFRKYLKLRCFFSDIPDGLILRVWARGESENYQRWLTSHEFTFVSDWKEQRNKALQMSDPPKISLIVPSFNANPDFFEDLIGSVFFQTYPFWELCIVDDGSSEKKSMRLLKRISKRDPRIKLHLLEKNTGICSATNHALEISSGEYVAFLDHDDRISPEALYYMGKNIIEDRKIDILYSDRDMISPAGKRFMHLFKPDWSPEILLSMNYIFHLMVYRKKLLTDIGGVRKEFEGSQDYDLILRAMDYHPNVCHIPKPLYHWRQHETSVSLNLNSKEYAFTAGVKALREFLSRRHLTGDVSEIEYLPRGHYKVALSHPGKDLYKVLYVPQTDLNNYRQLLADQLDIDDDIQFIVFLGQDVKPQNEDTVQALLSWLQIPEIGIVTGKILDKKGRIIHGGLVQKPDGIPLPVFSGCPEKEYGYMAATHITRNVSMPHPFCFAIRKTLFKDIGGFDVHYSGPHAIYDVGYRIIQKGYRIMYSPFEKFTCEETCGNLNDFSQKDLIYFSEKWKSRLKAGDPNYNKWLTLEYNDMGLSI